MKIGLYFGTFNPIHVGHMVIANYMAMHTDLEEVWLVLTPQNPLKDKKSLLSDHHRLALVREAVYENNKLRVSDIELGLSRPNYTSNTLAHLMDKYPKNDFALIMGEDNLRNFHKWFNYELILENHFIYVYPRVLTSEEEGNVNKEELVRSSNLKEHRNVRFCADAPVMKISSSFIRKSIKEKKDVRYLLTEKVFTYVDEMNFYK